MANVDKPLAYEAATQCGVLPTVLYDIIHNFHCDEKSKFEAAFRAALISVKEVDLFNRDEFKKALAKYFSLHRKQKNPTFNLSVFAATTTWASISVTAGVRIEFASTLRGLETLKIEHVSYKYAIKEDDNADVDTTDHELVAKCAEVARLAMNRKRRERQGRRSRAAR
jgi:hypothetical protein